MVVRRAGIGALGHGAVANVEECQCPRDIRQQLPAHREHDQGHIEGETEGGAPRAVDGESDFVDVGQLLIVLLEAEAIDENGNVGSRQEDLVHRRHLGDD